MRVALNNQTSSDTDTDYAEQRNHRAVSPERRRAERPTSQGQRFGGGVGDDKIFMGMTGKQLVSIMGLVVIASILVEQLGEIYMAIILVIGLGYFHMHSKQTEAKNRAREQRFEDERSERFRKESPPVRSARSPVPTPRVAGSPRPSPSPRGVSPRPSPFVGNKAISNKLAAPHYAQEPTSPARSDTSHTSSIDTPTGRKKMAPMVSGDIWNRISPPASPVGTPPGSRSLTPHASAGPTPEGSRTASAEPGSNRAAAVREDSEHGFRAGSESGTSRNRKVQSSTYQARVNASIAGKDFKTKSPRQDQEDSDADSDTPAGGRHREKTLGDCLADYYDRPDPFGQDKFEKVPVPLTDVQKADRLISALDGDNLNRFCVLVASDADLAVTRAENDPGGISGEQSRSFRDKSPHVWSCSPASLRSHIGAGTAFSFTPRTNGSTYSYTPVSQRGPSSERGGGGSPWPGGRGGTGYSPMVGASPANSTAHDGTPSMHSDHEQPVASETTEELTVIDSSYLNASLSGVANMAELDKFILQHVDEMDSVSYALAFSRGVRFDDSLHVLSRPGMKALLARIEGSLQDQNLVCISGAMCNVLWNMTKIRIRFNDKGSSNSQYLLSVAALMVEVATVNLWVFTQRELTNFMWSLSALAQSHNSQVRMPWEQDKTLLFRGLPPKFRVAVTRMFLTFSSLYKDLGQTFKGQEISNLAVAFCRSAHGVSHESSPSFMPMREMTTTMADQCSIRTGELQAQHVANTTWAFVKLGLSNPSILGKYLERVCATLCKENAVFFMKPQEVANIIWALARAKGKMGVEVSNVAETFPIVDRALISVKFNHFVPQDYANLVWSHACLDILDRDFFLSVFEHSKKTFHSFRSQELSNFLWGFSKTGVAPDVHTELYGMVKDILLTVPLDKHSNQSLVNICYSGIRMDQNEPDMYGAVAERLATQMQAQGPKAKSILTTQEMSNMAWVLAKLPESMIQGRIKDQTSMFMRTVSRICIMTLRNFSVQELANILWAVAKTGEQGDARLFSEAYPIVQSRKATLRPEEKAQIEWAYTTVDMDPLNDDHTPYGGNGHTMQQHGHGQGFGNYGRPPRGPKGKGKGGGWSGFEDGVLHNQKGGGNSGKGGGKGHGDGANNGGQSFGRPAPNNLGHSFVPGAASHPTGPPAAKPKAQSLSATGSGGRPGGALAGGGKKSDGLGTKVSLT